MRIQHRYSPSAVRCIAACVLLAVFLHGPGLTVQGPALEIPGAPAGNPLIVMPPHPRVLEEIREGARQPEEEAERKKAGYAPAREPAKLSGEIRALAILVSFSDRPETTRPAFFDSLIFARPGKDVRSVNSYYAEVSYGKVDIVTVNLPSTLGWARAPQTSAYYTNKSYCTDGAYPHNCQGLAEDVVDAVANRVDFSRYDNDHDGLAEPVMIIHSGKGAEYTGRSTDIWSHSWSLRDPRLFNGVWVSSYVIMPEYWQSASPMSSDMTIGVFAHEMGHGFWDLPDLYDTDYSSAGIGNWSLMASGSWNGPGNMGGSPAWPDAWSRVQMGFVTPTVLVGNTPGLSIPQAYGNPAAPGVFKIHNASQGPQEYYLIENREKDPASYDAFLPGSGLLIWHIDEDVYGNRMECGSTPDCTCDPGRHYMVDLEQADGLRQMETSGSRGNDGDVYPGNANNYRFTPTTNPASGSWYSCETTAIGIDAISAAGATMSANISLQGTSDFPTKYFEFLPLVSRQP